MKQSPHERELADAVDGHPDWVVVGVVAVHRTAPRAVVTHVAGMWELRLFDADHTLTATLAARDAVLLLAHVETIPAERSDHCTRCGECHAALTEPGWRFDADQCVCLPIWRACRVVAVHLAATVALDNGRST